jgi:uncharacterized protein (TIGR00369 family)
MPDAPPPRDSLKMTAAEVSAFIAIEFPQSLGTAQIEALTPGRLVCRGATGPHNLRPGGTISGPTMMTLADTAAYFLVLASVGPVALAVTSQLSIHFLRKPQLADLIATVTLLRLGRRQAVCAVELHSEGDPELVAHATVTYAIPA